MKMLAITGKMRNPSCLKSLFIELVVVKEFVRQCSIKGMRLEEIS